MTGPSRPLGYTSVRNGVQLYFCQDLQEIWAPRGAFTGSYPGCRRDCSSVASFDMALASPEHISRKAMSSRERLEKLRVQKGKLGVLAI
jgi:hypothetical protein